MLNSTLTELTDATGYTYSLGNPPQRIVSLVPSQTEFLFALGLENRVVGFTKFCVHPPLAKKEKKVVGGTKQIRMEELHALQPDFILANKEENTREMVENLRQTYPVWVTDVRTLPEAFQMMTEVGILTEKRAEAEQLVGNIAAAFGKLANLPIQRVLYLIWRNPYMAAGTDTFIHSLLQQAGFENVVRQPRYPELSPETMLQLAPEVVLLSSEPFPFKEKHIAELVAWLPESHIVLANGELFSWYGSRLLHSPDYFLELKKQLLLAR